MIAFNFLLPCSAQRPYLLKGHERTVTHVQFNPEGDLLFSCAKSYTPCVWFTDNGELAGTFAGHNGAVWSCDVSCTYLADPSYLRYVGSVERNCE